MRRLALVLVMVSCTQSNPPARSRESSAARALNRLEPLPPEQVTGALEAFAQWQRAYAASPSAELVPRGAALAVTRARAFATLIAADPARALELAMTPPARAALPAELQDLVERRVDGIGSLDVIAGTPEDPSAAAPAVERFVTVGGETLRAYVAGTRFERGTRREIRVHAVALGGIAAVSDRPTRRVFAGEALDDRLPFRSGGQCPVSRKNVPKDATVVNAGDALYQFCTPDHTLAFDETLAAEEDAFAEAAASAWSTGPKTVLVMRVDFDDLVGEPISVAGAQSLIDNTSSGFYEANSFDQTSMTATVTPLLRLPRPSTYYQMSDNYSGLRFDAVQAAADAGYPLASYSLDILTFKALYSGWAGRGSVGGRGNWLNGNFSARVTEHELGHNYGVMHANYWSAQNSSIIGAGTNQEYGNPYDVMGNGTSHFNAWFKRTFDWLTAAETPTITASGTYRIHALEQPITSGLHALKIPRGDGTRDYWVEFRQGIVGNRSLSSGASINWGYPYVTGSHLLDMTPGAPGGVSDSALTFGSTFSDSNYGIHITPLKKGGTTPESLDVVVNLGTFPGNRPPVATLTASSTMPAVSAPVAFTATASDPDGDALAYAWDFDDDTYVPSSASAMHAFTTARAYFVRCTVSDMKGGVVTRSVLVTVGAPARSTLQGTVSAAGVPVEGVRVGDSARVAYTDSDGKYALTDVPDASVTLSAVKRDYTFTPDFASPVSVTGDMTGLDFSGTHTGSYTVTGRVFMFPDAGIAGAVVSDGTRTATTTATGAFTLPGVPNGVYALTASKAGWQFTPKSIEVLGANVSGVALNPSGASLSGQIFGAAASATVTDGVRSTASNPNGASWYWSLSPLPSGKYNVVATLPGYTLTPRFSNPVSVTGTFVSNLHFDAVLSTTYSVSGTVSTGGVPLPGATVTDGTRSSTSDSLGRYVLVGLPAGSYTLTPTHASYTFVPLTRMVTVATADLTGQDFATTVVNPPPTVAVPASATPTTVTTGATTVLSVLGADDSGEAALRYTWSTTFFQAPTYSANGTNAAKTTTVTFNRSGTYLFEVLIEDPGGLSVRSSVTVVVQQTLISLQVTPPSANVLALALQSFNAQGRDQFNQPMFAGPYTWSVSGGGTISTFGLFTAGATAGGPHTVTVTGMGRTATALVTVTSPTGPMITAAASATPNPATATTTRLSVGATDDGGEPALNYTWSMSGGPAPVTFSDNGTNAAKVSTAMFTKAGAYQFVVSVVDASGNMATSVVNVDVEQTATTVQVAPPAATVQPGATQMFTATVEDQFGDSLVSQPPVTWTVAGGGTIDAAGLFTAGTMPAGPFTVTATAGAVSGTTTVTIVAGPDTRAPVVAIVAPTNDSRQELAFDAEVSATDDVGVAGVTLFIDGTALAEQTSPPYRWAIDPAALASGTHLLAARARDAAGNTADATPVRFVVGTTVDAPPTVTLSGVSEGSTLHGTVVLAVSASDDVAVMGLELVIDGAVAQTSGGATWMPALDTSMLADGPHTLQSRALDTAGQRGESPVLNVVVDQGGPTMPPEMLRGVCGCSGASSAPIALLLLLLSEIRGRRLRNRS